MCPLYGEGLSKPMGPTYLWEANSIKWALKIMSNSQHECFLQYSLIPSPSNFLFCSSIFHALFMVSNKIWNKKIRDLWASSWKEERREKERREGGGCMEDVCSIVIRIRVVVLIIFIFILFIFIKVSILFKPNVILIPKWTRTHRSLVLPLSSTIVAKFIPTPEKQYNHKQQYNQLQKVTIKGKINGYYVDLNRLPF